MSHLYIDIDLYGEGRHHFHVHGHRHFTLNFDEIILDPSVLYYLTSHKIKETNITYYLPDNMLRLIEKSKENTKYRAFLKSFLTYFRYVYGRRIEENDWDIFYENIKRMNIKPISLETIRIEQSNNYYEKYLNLFSKHSFYISMSPEINFLGDYIAKIMEFSRQTSKKILSKSRKLANLLRERITSLELPKHFLVLLNRFDNSVQIKRDFLGRMFNFPGGKSTQFFIGISLSIGGLTTVNHLIGGIGVVFAFIDP